MRMGAMSVLLFSTGAAAQEHDPKLAQSLFDRARELMERGEFAQACPLFVESQRLDPGGGTLLNIALCHEREGKLATAWAEYGEALSVATRDGRDDRRDLAKERIDALRPRLPKIRVLSPTKDVNLTLDGRALPAVSVGLDLPVDPGTHVVGATARGKRPWSTSPSLVEAQLVEVTVPELEAAPEAPPSDDGGARLATMSWVLGGVALAAIGTSVATGLMALSAERSSKDKCVLDRSYCPDPSYRDDASRATTLAWVSTGALAVGIGAAVGAFFWPRERHVGVTVTPASASVSAGFAF